MSDMSPVIVMAQSVSLSQCTECHRQSPDPATPHRTGGGDDLHPPHPIPTQDRGWGGPFVAMTDHHQPNCDDKYAVAAVTGLSHRYGDTRTVPDHWYHQTHTNDANLTGWVQRLNALPLTTVISVISSFRCTPVSSMISCLCFTVPMNKKSFQIVFLMNLFSSNKHTWQFCFETPSVKNKMWTITSRRCWGSRIHMLKSEW